jgi:hypothetical protein
MFDQMEASVSLCGERKGRGEMYLDLIDGELGRERELFDRAIGQHDLRAANKINKKYKSKIWESQ